jgi:hypothetical protein
VFITITYGSGLITSERYEAVCHNGNFQIGKQVGSGRYEEGIIVISGTN